MDSPQSKEQPLASVNLVEFHDRCGDCARTELVPANMDQLVCHGVPPTPMLIGMQQDLAGNMTPALQMQYPIVLRASRACAHFKPRNSIIS